MQNSPKVSRFSSWCKKCKHFLPAKKEAVIKLNIPLLKNAQLIFREITTWTRCCWCRYSMKIELVFLIHWIFFPLEKKSLSSKIIVIVWLYPSSQCLKISNICRIWILQFWHFSPIFVLLLKLTCLVTLFDKEFQIIKKSPNLRPFLVFLMNFCLLKMLM